MAAAGGANATDAAATSASATGSAATTSVTGAGSNVAVVSGQVLGLALLVFTFLNC